MDGLDQFYSLDTVAKHVFAYQMNHCGFTASIMRAPKLSNDGGRHALPPGFPIPVFPVSALPGCPQEWLSTGAYVCPVDSDWGIWFNWLNNDRLNTAIIPSVKGMNPITGRAVDGPGMESYEENCPVHGTPFSNNRFCEKCNYEWPPQNYVTHDSGRLWWDGFRQPDGTVRQFFFSEDEKRDIASLVIGKQNTVPAFGFVFYEPTKKRKEMVFKSRIRDIEYDLGLCKGTNPPKTSDPIWVVGDSFSYQEYFLDHSTKTNYADCGATLNITCCSGSSVDNYEPNSIDAGPVDAAVYSVQSGPVEQPRPRSLSALRSVSVGAGAEIMQTLAKDSLGIGKWKEEPSSIIRLYFCFRDQFEDIVSAGVVDPVCESGFLSGLPVG
jgi:hypothetical protein